MGRRPLRTIDIARELRVHVNTIRVYEVCGYFSEIPRDANGYRRFSTLHLEQARLAHLALTWPFLQEKSMLIALVKHAARGEFIAAMENAYHYLAYVRRELTETEAALEFLDQWAAGLIRESPQQKKSITETALYLNVTVDMLRNWERSGLLHVPRNPSNGYRLYGTSEYGRIRLIRILVQSGHSLMAVLRMLTQFDTGHTQNLRTALEIPSEETDVEYIEIIADHWHTSLLAFEQRAKAIIHHLRRLMEIARAL